MTEPGLPCPGTCNTAWRRAEKAYETALAEMHARIAAGEDDVAVPEPHAITADKGDPIWCPDCQAAYRADITRLPDLAVAVAIRIDGRLVAQIRAERVGTPGGSPSGSPAWDTFDEVCQWACSWEDAARSHFQHPAADLPSWTATRGKALEAATRYLTGWHQQILADPAIGHDFGFELLALVRRIERAAGLDGSVTKLRAPCRKCDLVGYERRDGSEVVECRLCHDRMTMEHYEQWSKLAASSVKDTA